jgi:hypothetical protein
MLIPETDEITGQCVDKLRGGSIRGRDEIRDAAGVFL